MSDINSIEKIGANDHLLPFHEEQSAAWQHEQNITESSHTAIALHEVFSQDILNPKTPDQLPPQPIEIEKPSSYSWNQFLSFFTGYHRQGITKNSSTKVSEEVCDKEAQAIAPIPNLEPPSHLFPDLKEASFAPVSKKEGSKRKLMSSDIDDILAMMNQQTIESIMFLIFRMHTELEKEHAAVAEGTYSKYLDFQKKQQELLLDIKEILIKDQNIANRLGTAQNLLWYANLIAGTIAAGVSFGALAPLSGTIATTTAAGLSAITFGSKAYFKRVMDDHHTTHETYLHRDRYYGDKLEDARNRLMTTADADTVFKERWIEFLKRLNKIRQLILKK
ncbi:MAG: hypothetical protein ACH350_07550 [Parachlamydiaceae bacterium]